MSLYDQIDRRIQELRESVRLTPDDRTGNAEYVCQACGEGHTTKQAVCDTCGHDAVEPVENSR